MKRKIGAVKNTEEKPKKQKINIEDSLDPKAAIKKAVIAGNVEDLKKLLLGHENFTEFTSTYLF